VGARERTVRGWGGGERHGVDEIACGELRREPQERAREGGRPPDMGKEGLGSESGGGRAARVGSDEGGGSNDRKTFAEYARRPRESSSVGEVEVMLVGFPEQKWIQGEGSDGVKAERVSWKESWRAGVTGREARRRNLAAARGPQKGSMGTGGLGAKV